MTHTVNFIQQVNILQGLGVTHWVQKSTPTIMLNHRTDRFADFDVDGVDIKVSDAMPDTADATRLVKSDLNDASPSDERGADGQTQPSKMVGDGKADSDDVQKAFNANEFHVQPERGLGADADSFDANADIRYELEGVRAGEWILVADVAQMNTDEQSIWLSLKSALVTWADQYGQPCGEHRLSYPMSDELPGSPDLAQKCLDGFVVYLQMLDAFTQKVAFLNDVPDGVDYFGEVVDLPSLKQMAHDVTFKKALWQQVAVA